MTKTLQSIFTPDYVVHPGDILRDELEAIGMRQKDLADRTGKSENNISKIVNGKAPITTEMALQLENVLNISAHIWNNLETHYQETLARIKEAQRLSRQKSWLAKFPINFMIEKQWLEYFDDTISQIKALLAFFGVASPDEWQSVWEQTEAAYRKSSESNQYALSAWLRKGELDGQNIDCAPYRESVFLRTLFDIRYLTNEYPQVFVPELKRLCSSCGVAVVFTPQTPNSRVCGVARWLSPSKALIQLSLRYKRNDILWFTFFHEAAHLLKHKKKKIYLEHETPDSSDEEKEADHFAANVLIPDDIFNAFVARRNFNRKSIVSFARSQGIAPGIVLGRLQKYGRIPWKTSMNDLKMKLQWL